MRETHGFSRWLDGCGKQYTEIQIAGQFNNRSYNRIHRPQNQMKICFTCKIEMEPWEFKIHILVESELKKRQLKQEVFRIFAESVKKRGIETFSYFIESPNDPNHAPGQRK